MDYGKAFTFFTEDENWITKLVIGGLLFVAGSVIPIIPLLPVLGYMLDLMQNVANENPRPLPVWENFEDKFRKGLNVFAIGIVYFLPLVLIGCCFLPLIIGVTSASSGGRGSSNDTGGGLAPLFYLCCICFGLVYGLAASILSSAATMIYASSGRLADAFKVGDVIALVQRHLGNFIMTMLVVVAASIIALILTIITCGLGSFVASPWVMMVQYHLLGQIYRRSQGAMPPPAMPPPMPTVPSM